MLTRGITFSAIWQQPGLKVVIQKIWFSNIFAALQRAVEINGAVPMSFDKSQPPSRSRGIGSLLMIK